MKIEIKKSYVLIDTPDKCLTCALSHYDGNYDEVECPLIKKTVLGNDIDVECPLKPITINADIEM